MAFRRKKSGEVAGSPLPYYARIVSGKAVLTLPGDPTYNVAEAAASEFFAGWQAEDDGTTKAADEHYTRAMDLGDFGAALKLQHRLVKGRVEASGVASVSGRALRILHERILGGGADPSSVPADGEACLYLLTKKDLHLAWWRGDRWALLGLSREMMQSAELERNPRTGSATIHILDSNGVELLLTLNEPGLNRCHLQGHVVEELAQELHAVLNN